MASGDDMDPVLSQDWIEVADGEVALVSFKCLAAALWGWIQRERDDVIAFRREENRVFKAQWRGRRLRLNSLSRTPRRAVRLLP